MGSDLGFIKNWGKSVMNIIEVKNILFKYDKYISLKTKYARFLLLLLFFVSVLLFFFLFGLEGRSWKGEDVFYFTIHTTIENYGAQFSTSRVVVCAAWQSLSNKNLVSPMWMSPCCEGREHHRKNKDISKVSLNRIFVSFPWGTGGFLSSSKLWTN